MPFRVISTRFILNLDPSTNTLHLEHTEDAITILDFHIYINISHLSSLNGSFNYSIHNLNTKECVTPKSYNIFKNEPS